MQRIFTSKQFSKGIFSGCLFLAFFGFQFNAFAQLSGTYTIGGSSPSYATFSAAVSALNSIGVSGPVVFDVRSGTYTENITLTDISGVSATNTVTFRSETGVAANVTLQSSSTDVVVLHNADYHIFENVTISYTGTGAYSAIELQDDADNVTITSCILNGGSSTSTSFSNALIYVNESTTSLLIDDLVVQNSTFNGAACGIYFASGTTESTGIEVSGNDFSNCFSKAIFLDDCTAPLVQNNSITNASNANSSYTAIELAYGSGASIVTGNEIVSSYIKYGIVINNADGTAGNEVLVANNMISMGGANPFNQPQGIKLTGSDYVNVYFNSIHVSNTYNTSLTACLYLTSSSTDNSINIVNNIFAMTGGGSSQACIYIGSTSYIADINVWDYNDYYTTGSSYVAYAGGTRTTLANLQSYTSKDANSLSIDPLFTSSTDLHTTETALAAGTTIGTIGEDIDGDFRVSPPYMGADEIAAPAVGDDAGVSAMVTPTIPPCSGSIPFEVTVTNYGTNTLTSVTIDWTINGVAQTTVNATGLSVASTGTVDISLGNATLISNTPYTVVFTSSSPNGATDANSANDSFAPAVFSTSLSGTYTIGGTTPDYANFTDAVDALQSYGVCGPVVFNVRQGTYTEQVSIGPITNASATNTVTFQADPANSTAAILEYNSQAFATNYVLGFNEASYLRFLDLTISTTTTGSYRSVLKFDNNNTDIIFDGNVLESTVATNNSINYAVVFMEDNNDTYDNDIVFNNNEILNGSYGLYFDGYTSDYETGNVITNNTITGFYRTGIFAAYQDGILIQGNEVRGSGPYLIAADFADFIGYVAITENIFEAAGSGSSSNIALQMLDCDGTSGTHSLVANNFFIATAPGSTVEGIRFGSSTIYYDFVANNIYVKGTNASSTSGVYFNGADEIGFYSNNIMCDGPGNCIEYLTTGNQLYSNYNNLYATGGGIIGYYSGDRTALADWQSAASIDANSVSVDPLYTSVSSTFDLHISESSLAGAGDAYTGITLDIDGDTRDTPPTIGADEITPTGCVTPIASNTITGGGSFCAEAPTGTLSGAAPSGGSGTYTYAWEVSTNGTTYSSAGTGQNETYAAIIANTWYRRVVTSGTCADTSNVLTFEVTPVITSNTVSGTGTFCDEIPAGTLTGATPAGGSGSYTYQWKESTDGTTFADVATGGTSINYSYATSSASVWYQRVATSGQCADTSAAAVLTVKSGYIWTGDISTNWHVPANWDCGDVPDLTTDVLIPAAATNQPEILTDSIGECHTIEIEPGSDVIIRSAGTLNVEN